VTQRAVDISNWQGDLPEQVYADWSAAGIRTVICGTSGNPAAPLVYEAQARKVVLAGLRPEAYTWLTWPVDVDAFAARIRGKLDLIERISTVEDVWLDCEDEVVEPGADVVGLIALARELVRERGLVPGIYTGAWWWPKYTGNSGGFFDLRLWLAHYDGIAELISALLPFGGWVPETLYRKQHTDKGEVGGVFPLDLNVERDPTEPFVVPIPPAPGPDLVAVRRHLVEIHAAATAAETALGGS